jgi:hypothetical protein
MKVIGRTDEESGIEIPPCLPMVAARVSAMCLVVATLLACSSKVAQTGLEPCGTAGECSQGYTCHTDDNLCYQQAASDVDAATVDGRIDASTRSDAAGDDAPRPDAVVDAAPHIDAGAVDAPSIDARPIDARPPDAGPDAAAVEPDTVIDSSPPNVATSAFATFTFHSTVASSTFMCQVDADPVASCASGVMVGPLADGSHMFAVHAVSPDGVADPTPATYVWRIDTTPPTTMILAGPMGTVATSDAAFSFGASEAATFECRLDGAAFTPCTSPRTYSGVANGTHDFSVRAIDLAGNIDPSPPSRTWVIDTTNPTTHIDSGPDSLTRATSATFTFSSNETGATFGCLLDSEPDFTPCSSPWTVPGPLADGAHVFQVRSVNAAGTVDPNPASWRWTIDTIGPSVQLLTGPSGGMTTGTSVAFTYRASEGDATVDCQLDGNAYASCPTSGVSYTGLAGGNHTFHVHALDPLGNTGPAVTASWNVDATGAVVTIDIPAQGGRTGPHGIVYFHPLGRGSDGLRMQARHRRRLRSLRPRQRLPVLGAFQRPAPLRGARDRQLRIRRSRRCSDLDGGRHRPDGRHRHGRFPSRHRRGRLHVPFRP